MNFFIWEPHFGDKATLFFMKLRFKLHQHPKI